MAPLISETKALLAACLLLQANGQKPDQSISCTVCQDRSVVRFPDSVPVDEGILAGQTCQQIDRAVGILHPNASSTECQAVQSIGVLCGCPPASNTCTICPMGARVTHPGKTLPFLSHLFSGFTPTCGVLEAYFLSTDNSADDGMCTMAQGYIADYCGCGQTNNETSSSTAVETEEERCSICSIKNDTMSYPNRTLTLEGFPFQTCSGLEEAARTLFTADSDQCGPLQELGAYCGCPVRDVVEPCTFCPDGSPVSLVDRPFPLLQDRFGGYTPSCGMVESTIVQLESDSGSCRALQLMSSMCGCPAVEDHCRYCDEWEDEVPREYADRPLPLFPEYFGGDFGSDVTCEEAFYSQYQFASTDRRCYLGRLGSWECGCNGGSVIYLSADTVAKKMVLAWIPRVTGTLSILVSASACFA